MDADFIEIEQPVEQAHVPISGAARADVPENPALRAGEVLGADRGDRAGAHVGEPRRIDDRQRAAGPRIEQIEETHLRGQTVAVIVDVVGDDLDTCETERRDIASQHIEVTVEGSIRREMHAGLDHGLAMPLRAKARVDGVEDLVIAKREARDIEGVEVVQFERFGHAAEYRCVAGKCAWYGRQRVCGGTRRRQGEASLVGALPRSIYNRALRMM